MALFSFGKPLTLVDGFLFECVLKTVVYYVRIKTEKVLKIINPHVRVGFFG